MAKKKQAETVNPPADENRSGNAAPELPQAAAAPAEDLGGLAKDVEAFITQREQLAQKLAEEIASTEKKLAELKRTAAMLFPEKETAPSQAKDRKAKTSLIAKTPKRKTEAASAESVAGPKSGDSSGEPAAVQEGAPHEPHLD